MFEQRTFVNGNLISGQIIRREFHMSNIGSSNTLPPVQNRVFSKSDIERLIEELRLIKEKM